MKRASHPSPILLGLFFTFLVLGLTIIARLYWKSRKIKTEIVKEDKYSMESRCSLLKQDTFAVSWNENVSSFNFNFNEFSLLFLIHHRRMPSLVQSLKARASKREGKLRL